LAYLLARRLGIREVDAHTIELAARLHDIGVLGINHLVLAKPSRLNHIERLVVRQHTVIGSEMLGRGRHPSMQLAAKVALTHHEWWDGSGYPNQLLQEQIPLEARIVALADAYDAMAGERPYQLAFSHTMACEELHFMSGKQFDPNLVTAFIEIVDDYRSRYGDLGDAGYRSWVADSAILSRHEQILELLALE
jgi:putative two-component system response regulator